MGGLAIAAGAVLLTVTLVEVFITVFAYDGFTFVAPRLHRAAWPLLRGTATHLPDRPRHAVLSLGSAALLPATFAFWLGLETVAFGLMFLPGVSGSGFAGSAHGHGAGAAFYLSGGDLTSLTFGDLVPRTAFDPAMTDLKTVIGLGTFTLGLTYVLSAFDARAKLDRLYARVRRNAVEPNRPETIIERRYRSGDPPYLETFLQSAVDDLEDYGGALRRYPVAFCFHTRRVERATPHIFDALGQLIELLRRGLPADEPLTDDPALLALMDAFHSTTGRLLRSFVGGTAVGPAPTDATTVARRTGTGDRFRHMQLVARRAAGLSTDPEDGREELDRCRDWSAFRQRQDVFLDRMRAALGY